MEAPSSTTVKPLRSIDTFAQKVAPAAIVPLEAIPELADRTAPRGSAPAAEAITDRTGDDAPQSLPGFELGSDVELGRALLEELREGSSEAIVYAAGSFYRYDDLAGLHRPMPLQSVELAMQEFDGAPTRKGALVLKQSRIQGGIACARAQAFSDDFFATATPGIAFIDGFLRVQGGRLELLPHAAGHRATVGMKIPYPSAARAPRFERYFVEVFDGDEDAADKVSLLQEFAGACLVGIATRYQAALVPVGEGANGKTVFGDVLGGVFPADAATSIPPQDFGNEYRRAMLVDVRYNFVSELPEAEILASESFKSIVDGSQITGRAIREAPFSFRPTAGHLFAANRLPGSTDQSWGFWRRLLPVTFNRIFLDAEQVKGLADVILAEEFPGVVAWALAGASRLMATERYTIPASTLAARDAWRHGADQVQQFIDEQVVRSEDFEVKASDLYDAYARWVKANGHRALSSNKFADRMLKAGFERRRVAAGSLWTLELRSAVAGGWR